MTVLFPIFCIAGVVVLLAIACGVGMERTHDDYDRFPDNLRQPDVLQAIDDIDEGVA